MKIALILLNLLLWPVSLLHFVLHTLWLILLGSLFGTRRVEWYVKIWARCILFFTGAWREVRRAPGFDPKKTYLFVSNHVNLFDPFVLSPSIPQYVRGVELESHFKIPVYGWAMKRFGNVPVPDARDPEGLKRTYRLMKEALSTGLSLVMFPEGGRTRDGKLRPFEAGVFRIARQIGATIVPVTIEGAYRWYRTGGRWIRPGKITVHLHEPIDMGGVGRDGLEEMRDRVRAIIGGPLGE